MVDAAYAYGPSDFVIAEDSFLVPRKLCVPHSVQDIVKTKRPTILLLSHTLSMDTEIGDYMRAHHHMGIRLPADRTAAIMEAIRTFELTGVLSMQQSAAQLETALVAVSLNTRIEVWYLIEPAAERDTFSPQSGYACREAQIFPGISVFFQCEHLGKENRDRYHLADGLALEEVEGTLLVTNIDDAPLPLMRTPVARGGVSEKNCACGKRILTLASYE